MVPLTALKNLPVVGRFVTWAVDHFRLALEYLLIALVIAASAFGLKMYIESSKHEKLQLKTMVQLTALSKDLQEQKANNQLIADGLEHLGSMRQRDSAALAGLIHDLRVLSAKDESARKVLEELENRNDEVRSYLDTPIPVRLACVLNETCSDADGDSVSAGSSSK